MRCADILIDGARLDAACLAYTPPHDPAPRFMAMVRGEHVNTTEDRPALHMALRAPHDNTDLPYPAAAREAVHRMKDAMRAVPPVTGRVVQIGIGGSALGPQLVRDALGLERLEILSSMTASVIERTLAGLEPARDLVLLVSKSFTTDEVMTVFDLLIARGWPMDRLIAVTAQPEIAAARGFAPAQVIAFPVWVGGRFSLWSSVGLGVALAGGWQVYEDLCRGAWMVDQDILGATDINAHPIAHMARWMQAQRVAHARPALAILPYHGALGLLPAYAQQLIMESNGKGTNTAPIVFGATGTEFQHSFGQFLHQGPDLCLSLFITFADAPAKVNANARAQADTLWHGAPHDTPYKSLSGGRPSVMLSLPTLSAVTLGQVIAFLEHATVLDAFMAGINPFDQWGVEAGKIMAQHLLRA